MSPDVMAWIASTWAPPLRRECWWVHDPMGPADTGATCDGDRVCTSPVYSRRAAAHDVTHLDESAQEQRR